MARAIGLEIKKCVHWKEQQLKDSKKATLEEGTDDKEDEMKKDAVPIVPGTSN